jgi:tripartite-type tricarboxylate transporter receptor subunit TctC
MKLIHRRTLLAAGAACALPAFAQVFPNRPIKLVVPYPPGGVSDVVARALAEKVAAQSGFPVVVENKPGASATLGMDFVAKSPADGHVLAFSAISPLVLSPHLGKVPYEAIHDFTPIASIMYSPVLLLATPASAAKDFRDLLGGAKDQPKSVRWATSGNASLGHLMLEHVVAAARVDVVHVPYKGGGQQLTDALSGQFEVLSTNASPAIQEHIRSGKLRPLAVGAPKRLESLPTVPTLAELGYPRANLSSQFGVFGPGGIPPKILDRLNGMFNTALQAADVRQRLLAADNVPTGGSSGAFAKEILAESDNNARIIKAVGIKAD